MSQCMPYTVEPYYYDFEETTIKKHIIWENVLTGKYII